jgi:hypothetical protein
METWDGSARQGAYPSHISILPHITLRHEFRNIAHATEEKCGHLGDKGLVPTQTAIRHLVAARLAAGI